MCACVHVCEWERRRERACVAKMPTIFWIQKVWNFFFWNFVQTNFHEILISLELLGKANFADVCQCQLECVLEVLFLSLFSLCCFWSYWLWWLRWMLCVCVAFCQPSVLRVGDRGYIIIERRKADIFSHATFLNGKLENSLHTNCHSIFLERQSHHCQGQSHPARDNLTTAGTFD